MNDLKKQFIEFTLDHQILRFGNFSLNSGRQSPYFFNTGLCNTGELLAKLAKFYSDLLVENDIKYDFIFGPAYKGITLATSISNSLYASHNLNKPFCFNRKEAKTHGEKGVFVGSSGTILVNINNNGLISVSLTIDGVTYPFTSNVSITENQQTEITFAFENNSFTFIVDADGSNPQITNVSIEGHPDASIIVVKENSSYVAELYEGTYEGIDQNNDAGTFNAIVFNDEVYVLYKSTVYGSTSNAIGSVDGNAISGVSTQGTIFSGNIEPGSSRPKSSLSVRSSTEKCNLVSIHLSGFLANSG